MEQAQSTSSSQWECATYGLLVSPTHRAAPPSRLPEASGFKRRGQESQQSPRCPSPSHAFVSVHSSLCLRSPLTEVLASPFYQSLSVPGHKTPAQNHLMHGSVSSLGRRGLCAQPQCCDNSLKSRFLETVSFLKCEGH